MIPHRFQENYQAAEAEGTGMGVTMVSLQAGAHQQLVLSMPLQDATNTLI